MEKVKYSLAMALLALLVLFAIQNMAVVELNFLFWSFHSRRFLIIVFALVIGFALGWLLGAKKAKHDDGDND